MTFPPLYALTFTAPTEPPSPPIVCLFTMVPTMDVALTAIAKAFPFVSPLALAKVLGPALMGLEPLIMAKRLKGHAAADEWPPPTKPPSMPSTRPR